MEKVFSGYGALKEVWMTNSTPCFGFAVFKDKKAAAAALKATDGMYVAIFILKFNINNFFL